MWIFKTFVVGTQPIYKVEGNAFITFLKKLFFDILFTIFQNYFHEPKTFDFFFFIQKKMIIKMNNTKNL